MPLLSTSNKILFNFFLYRSTSYADELLGIISVDFEETCQFQAICSTFGNYLRKNWNKIKQYINCL